jgi:DNA modification methylase
MTMKPLSCGDADRRSWTATGGGQLADSVVDRFANADWDLVDADPGFNLHPYPARFVLQLPVLALNLLKPEVGVIDPFCGSGTTLAAASRAGLQSTGVDLNPIACLISRVRVGSWLEGDDESAIRHATALVKSAQCVPADVLEELQATIPRIDHWFEPWAQRLLAGAVSYLATIDPTDCWHDRIALSISSTVVRLSRQDSDTRYAAIEKNLGESNGLALLAASVKRTSDFLRVQSREIQGRTSVYNSDARDLSMLPDESHDAAVFSPPYPNAYEYWLYHKYRMYWLQYDPIAVRESEMGARPHYFRSTLPETEVDFGEQMGEVFAGLARVLRPGSPAVVVVGDSVIRGRSIDNRELIFDAAESSGFMPRAATLRTIRRSRSSFNSNHGSGRNVEHVLLLEKRP